MLKRLQIAVLVVLGIAIVAFALWTHFLGGAWWLAPIGALAVYLGILSGFFLGDPQAWHSKSVRALYQFALSTNRRATASLCVLTPLASALGLLAYLERPPNTKYFEVRLYDQVDAPGKYQVGATVILHSRTDGLTHKEAIQPDGGALFRSLVAPTTLAYQIELRAVSPPFLIGGNHKVDKLPDQLAIDLRAIPAERRLPLGPASIDTASRPAGYLAGVEQRGDASLQSENAPWGVPRADLIVNRLSYVLGYDFKRRMPRWVAYSVAPAAQSLERVESWRLDPAIPSQQQASLEDYRFSGFDRGHLISPADLFFRGPVGVAEAYYMSTVTPQTPWLNRVLWSDVEVRVRREVQRRQAIAYIIAGPLFLAPGRETEQSFQTVGTGRIPVPTHFFRVVAMRAANDSIEAYGVIMPNASNGDRTFERYLVPLREIEERSGLQFFPLRARPRPSEPLP
jgi:DNA/RNA endonuclease G (NUC1)